MRIIPNRLTRAAVAVSMTLAMAQTAPAAYVAATGGDSTNDVDGYRIHTFTNSGNFVVSSSGNVEVLVVAGGGGGGSSYGGGGGAGGLICSSSVPVAVSSITVTVGAGGAGGSAGGPNQGGNGTNSKFATLTAFGGGGGGGGTTAGKAGGSGGGSGGEGSGGGAATNEQGHTGGNGYLGGCYGGGGGGGAGAGGASGTSTTGGSGGAGVSNAISGTWLWYAGGGGGGTWQSGTGGPGGAGGGGAGSGFGGASTSTPGFSGTNGTGGGGGGAGYSTSWTPSTPAGGSGGSGIVIVRYALLSPNPVAENRSATNVTATNAWLNGVLASTSTGEQATVRVYWGATDGGTNRENWENTNDFGSVAVGAPLTTNVSINSNTTYYYRFYATNAAGEGWTASAESFSLPVLMCTLQVVGATNATLLGDLTSGMSAAVQVFWGPDTNTWAHTNSLGTLGQGTFYAVADGLSQGTPYYYRCYGTNAYGEGWSEVAAFTTGVGVANSFFGGSYDGYDRRDGQPLMQSYKGTVFSIH